MQQHRPWSLTLFLKTALTSVAYCWLPRGPYLPVTPLPHDWRSHLLYFRPKGSKELLTYTVDDYEATTGIYYTPFLLAENRKTLALVRRRCRQLLDSQTLARDVLWYGAYYGKILDSGAIPPVYIGWTGSIKEWGLFARESLPSGTLIGEYSGLLILFRYLFHTINPYCFHYPLPLSDWLWFTINAAPYGNETRFMNHSDDANCAARILFSAGILRIVLITERPIAADEELTYDYGTTIWGETRTFS